MVDLMPNVKGTFAVGVDVGGTNIRAGVITREGKKLAEARRPARAMEGLAVTQQMIIEAAEEAMKNAEVNPAELMGIGMGVPGRHNSAAGIVLYSPNFAGWTDVPLLKKIEEHFQVGAYMRNDVKTASMGEYYFGAGKGYKYIVMITLGTGIGGSLIADGKLMLGSGEGFAEVGHMTVDPNGRLCGCGNHGCWEAMAGRDAIIERAWKRLQTGRPSLLGDITNYDLNKITPALIAKAANDGDALAKDVLDETAMWVGIGVANLIQVYNPEIFIIGGGISQAGDLLFSGIRRTANWRGKMVPATDVKIVPAALGDDAGIFGGATLVFEAAKETK
ncbi:MAG TPA: ROK family protein [Armatimonadota bacterium]|nr:ROK family protein [Armatimonadota bacterium]